jgi:hypothetical protein
VTSLVTQRPSPSDMKLPPSKSSFDAFAAQLGQDGIAAGHV